mgnify:CR=1 FL=1
MNPEWLSLDHRLTIGELSVESWVVCLTYILRWSCSQESLRVLILLSLLCIKVMLLDCGSFHNGLHIVISTFAIRTYWEQNDQDLYINTSKLECSNWDHLKTFKPNYLRRSIRTIFVHISCDLGCVIHWLITRKFYFCQLQKEVRLKA